MTRTNRSTRDPALQRREAIARIVDTEPMVWDLVEASRVLLTSDARQALAQRRNHALAKADAILALILSEQDHQGKQGLSSSSADLGGDGLVGATEKPEGH